jgi:hypothetical protein
MGGAESGALGSDSATKQQGSIDLPDDVAKLWGTLPEVVKSQILALLSRPAKAKGSTVPSPMQAQPPL